MWIVWLTGFILLPVMGIIYVSWHIWELLPLPAMWRGGAVGLLVAAVLLMFAGFTGVTERMPLAAAKATYETGNSMTVLLLYLTLAFAVLDLCQWTHLIPRAWLHDNGYTAMGMACLMALLLGYGYAHYRHKFRQELRLETPKRVSDHIARREKKVVLLSDLHLGYHISRREFARWVDLLNDEHPDLILIGGDIIDISVRPLLMEGVAREFRRLKAPVYACLGNHEYYAGEPRARKFYQEAGIVLLRDSVAVADGITIIGRDDRSNARRTPLRELISHVDHSTYVILLDHQPYHLEEAEQAGIDFQFSGHTHDGQVWPISWLTSTMYEKSFGYLRKGHTKYYVTSGIGIWGPKFRLGTRSEYVVATLCQQDGTGTSLSGR